MSHKRFLKILLVVLSLAVWAGTANATSVTNFASSVPAMSLTYINGGGGAQTLASQTVTISYSATAISNGDASDAYTISATGWPSWLTTVTGASITAAGPATPAIAVNVPGLPANPSYPATYTYTILFQQAGHANLSLPVTLTLLNSPLSLGPVLQFGAVGTTYTNNNQSFPMNLASPDANFDPTDFAVDPATQPSWLDISQSQNNGTTTGTPASSAAVVFALDPNVTPALAPGIYTAKVGFIVVTTLGGTIPSAVYGEYFVSVSVAVSNPAPTLLLKEGIDGTVINKTWSAGMTIPIPTVTPYSSNEPIPFTALCNITLTNAAAVTLTPACSLTPAGAVAYSWGTVVDVPALSPGFFNGVALGNTVSVAITVTPSTGATPPTTTITFIYTLVPIPATITSLSPSAVAPLASADYSTVVLVQGTGFVSASNIATGSGLGPTKVWLGTTPAASTVVMSSTLMAVTVPSNSISLPSGSTSGTLAIGVANYSGGVAPSAPTSSYNLTITTGPVVYGLTSGATFKQPVPGNLPQCRRL
jgi:hypothetical protein